MKQNVTISFNLRQHSRIAYLFHAVTGAGSIQDSGNFSKKFSFEFTLYLRLHDVISENFRELSLIVDYEFGNADSWKFGLLDLSLNISIIELNMKFRACCIKQRRIVTIVSYEIQIIITVII